MPKVVKKGTVERAEEKGKKKGVKGLVAVGALIAAIGGAYFFTRSKKGAGKTVVKAWILRAKADVMEEIEKLPKVTRKAYTGVVQAVLKRYAKVKDVTKEELAELKADLEGQWKTAIGSLKK